VLLEAVEPGMLCVNLGNLLPSSPHGGMRAYFIFRGLPPCPAPPRSRTE
jgi:hypothetical protein